MLKLVIGLLVALAVTVVLTAQPTDFDLVIRKADIMIFDPAAARDTATFGKPHSYAEGFSHELVNGVVVFENGAMTPARPGRVLYGPARP